MRFAVVTDTSGNLLNRQVKDRGLAVIPFLYTYDGVEHTCLDTDRFDGDAYYKMLRTMTVTTSQINPQTYADYFTEHLKEGRDVLYVSMSSGISGSCQSAALGAELALEAYPERKIEIVDTRGASLGEGLVALRAADLRDREMDVTAAAEELRAMSERLFNVFTVDDLLFLRRGGRLSNLLAVEILGDHDIAQGSEILEQPHCHLVGASVHLAYLPGDTYRDVRRENGGEAAVLRLCI